MRKKLLSGVLAVALAALVGIHAPGVSAQQASQLFSIVAHFEYSNGFSFDYVLAEGVPPSEVNSLLQYCGQSHWTGSVVRYHCYPVPE
jgi:hypothetical protein